MQGSIRAVEEAIGRPCSYVAGAVDAIRFSPYPNPPTRVIDVYNIGRRSEAIHQALRRASTSGNLFYVYDTLQGGGGIPVSDPAQHRQLFANMAKRSRYFMVAPGKTNVKEETQGQVEVGFRYFEGAAAGTVMIGQASDCESFRQMFDWPDAVIEIKPDGSDVADILADLADQPDRLHEISRRNAVEALLRHDWIYRWRKVYQIAGLEPTAAMDAREKHLKEVAELAMNGR